MTDSDYVDETLYLFSEHTNTLQKLYIFDANAGYTQKIFKPWSVTAFIGYNSVSAKMAARNGYLEYPVGSDPEPFYGTGIANEHNYQIAYLGIGTTLSFFDIIYIQFFARYSPLVYCQGIDFHYRREIDFFTNMEGGDYLSFTGVIGWKINENLTAILSVHYTDIKTNLGESYYVDLATGFESEPSAQTSSASYNSTSFTISFEHSLTWINKPDKFPDKKPEKNSKPVEGDIESPL
jgi:outer membrane protease